MIISKTHAKRTCSHASYGEGPTCQEKEERLIVKFLLRIYNGIKIHVLIQSGLYTAVPVLARVQSVHIYKDISYLGLRPQIFATDKDSQTSALPISLFFSYGRPSDAPPTSGRNPLVDDGHSGALDSPSLIEISMHAPIPRLQMLTCNGD